MTAVPESHHTVIAIDGPAASGKSSVARLLARRLDVAYVSSGLLYRAATLAALRTSFDLADEDALIELLGRHQVTLHADAHGNRVSIDGADVTDELNTDAIDVAVSTVARHPRVRAWVTDRLREVQGSFVIDGRDMGTAVFPHARVKFFLTADPEIRAARRAGERSGELRQIAERLRKRDEQDALQSAPATDAIFIDTGTLTLGQVVDEVLSRVQAVLPTGLDEK
ncbi:MAG: (d)CMP kinase [Trueperaceae bacterium]